MDEEELSGQRSGPCTIANCNELGRTLARFGGIELIYCPRHRKYGQEVIRTFLEDVLNYRKSSLYDIAKQELIFGGERILDDENEKKLGSWVRKEIYQRYLKDIGTSEISIREFEDIRDEDFGTGSKDIATAIPATTGVLGPTTEKGGDLREVLHVDKPGQAPIVAHTGSKLIVSVVHIGVS